MGLLFSFFLLGEVPYGSELILIGKRGWQRQCALLPSLPSWVSLLHRDLTSSLLRSSALFQTLMLNSSCLFVVLGFFLWEEQAPVTSS